MNLLRLEWRRLLASPLPWVLMALSVALLAWGFLHLVNLFLAIQTKLAALPSGPGFTDLVAVPLLSRLGTVNLSQISLVQLSLLLAPLIMMASLAGERRHATLPTLLAAGRSPLGIVLAKFLAGWSWLLLLLALTLAMPLLLAGATQLDLGKLAAAGLGTALFMGALAAIGLACSAWTRHPPLAVGAAWLVSLGLLFINFNVRAAGERGGVLDWLALPTHLQPMLRGLVTSADLVYFALLIGVALALATLRLGHERMSD